MPEYIPPKAAAERLAVSVKTVYKLVSRGELLALRVGRAVRVLASSLEGYIASHTSKEPAAPEPPSTPRATPPHRASEFVFLPRRS